MKSYLMTALLKEKLSRVEDELDTLRTVYHVKRIGFFGSIVRKDFTKNSDIDVLVEFSQPVGFFKFLELERFLKKILGFEVDLVTKNAIKTAVRKSIINEVTYV